MKSKISIVTVLVGFSIIASASAYAAETSVEVKPLLLFKGFNHDLGGPGIDTNGARGLGVEVEWPLLDHVMMNAGFSASYYRISDSDDAKNRNRDESDPNRTWAELQNAGTLRASAGGHYYGDVEQSSWYAGGRLGLGGSRSFYEQSKRSDLTLNQTTTELEGTLDAGYRWLLGSNFLIRTGATFTVREMLSRKIDGEDKNPEMSRNIKATYGREQFPAIDLGLGYRF